MQATMHLPNLPKTIGYDRAQDFHYKLPDTTPKDKGRIVTGLIIQRTRQALDMSRRAFVAMVRFDLKKRTGQDITFSDVTLGRLEEGKESDMVTLHKLAPYLPDPLQLKKMLTPNRLYGIYVGFIEVDLQIVQHDAFTAAVRGLYGRKENTYEKVEIDPDRLAVLIEQEMEFRNLTISGFAKLVGYREYTLKNILTGRIGKHGVDAKVRTLARFITNLDTGRPYSLEEVIELCKKGSAFLDNETAAYHK